MKLSEITYFLLVTSLSTHLRRRGDQRKPKTMSSAMAFKRSGAATTSAASPRTTPPPGGGGCANMKIA